MAAQLPLDQALTWHLQSNCYPPIDLRWVPVCIEIINGVDNCETHREVSAFLLDHQFNGYSAAEIFEGMHLNDFVQSKEDF